MATARKISSLEKRLREIEREKRRVRERIDEVKQWAEALPASAHLLHEPRLRKAPAAPAPTFLPADQIPPPVAFGALEMEAVDVPDNAISLEFAPGPDGLDKRVVMPRLQRTDLLRPSMGSHPLPTRIMEPEHDRFRNFFGTTGLKRVRESRRERGNHKVRAIFTLCMVFVLGYILFKMVT
jgi:hypothetical protein